MKRHALFVGVDSYADRKIQDLHCAVNDATELAGFFKHRALFDRAEALPNPRTCEDVLERVRDMLVGLKGGDEFLFFFAGHGVKTQDGHRLVCAGDQLAAVKRAWAGIPLERLKFETAGTFNRLFLLDACRTDVLATNRGAAGAMEKGTRDLILESACQAGADAGSLTILCSCDDGECAGEILQFRHGLFSMAMLDLLDEESRCGRRVAVSDDFAYRQIPDKMRALAARADMDFSQKPQKRGPPIVILDGVAPMPSTPQPPPEKVRTHYVAYEKSRQEAVAEEARFVALLETGDVKKFILPGGEVMEMIYCAPGEFMMGSPESEIGRHSDETLHHVKLTKGFWLGKYPVTQKQWESVMGDNPANFKGDNRPVEQVSWDDCQKFIDKVTENASRRFGGNARFPTEAEWEYACRAGTESAYANLSKDLANLVFATNPFQLQLAQSVQVGWHSDNSSTFLWWVKQTHPVGQKSPNAWGFHDMYGNVWEWCADWYGDYHGDAVDPTVSAPEPRHVLRGTIKNTVSRAEKVISALFSAFGMSYGRVLRGGSWYSNSYRCRSACRYYYYPSGRSNDIGFRLCCSTEPRGEAEQSRERRRTMPKGGSRGARVRGTKAWVP